MKLASLALVTGALLLAGFVLVGDFPTLLPATFGQTPASSVVDAAPAAPEAPIAAPAPDARHAQPIDPRRLAADPTFYRDANVELIGKTSFIVDRQEDYTVAVLDAQAPGDGSMIQPLNFKIRMPLRGGTVLAPQCYHLFGVIGATDPATRAVTLDVYRVNNVLPMSPDGRCFAQWGV